MKIILFTVFLFATTIVIGLNADIAKSTSTQFASGEIAESDLPKLLEYTTVYDGSESPFPWVLSTADANLNIDNIRNNDTISIPLLDDDLYVINKTNLTPCLEHPNYRPEWCEQGAEIFEGTITNSSNDQNSVVLYLLPTTNELRGNIGPQPGLTDYGVQFETSGNEGILVTFYDPNQLPPPL